jgi:Tol biopolymer transport system component
MFVSSSQFDWSPQFSPDGTRVAFESNRRGRLQIWTANADGSNQRPLTEPIGVVGSGSPRWSPDGRWIAYDEHLPNGLRGVFVIAAEGGARREIATGAIPRWSQDGQIIYFNRENGIWRIPSTGGKEEQIVPVGNGGDESADGASLYYRKVTTPGVLFAVPRMGGAEREVLSSPGLAGPAVVPVADGIYFHTTVPGSPTSREIRFFDFATRQTRRVFSIETRDGTAFAVSPDRRTVLYSKTSPDASVDIALIRNFH